MNSKPIRPMGFSKRSAMLCSSRWTRARASGIRKVVGVQQRGWRGGEQGTPRTLRARKSPMVTLNPRLCMARSSGRLVGLGVRVGLAEGRMLQCQTLYPEYARECREVHIETAGGVQLRQQVDIGQARLAEAEAVIAD